MQDDVKIHRNWAVAIVLVVIAVVTGISSANYVNREFEREAMKLGYEQQRIPNTATDLWVKAKQ